MFPGPAPLLPLRVGALSPATRPPARAPTPPLPPPALSGPSATPPSPHRCLGLGLGLSLRLVGGLGDLGSGRWRRRRWECHWPGHVDEVATLGARREGRGPAGLLGRRFCLRIWRCRGRNLVRLGRYAEMLAAASATKQRVRVRFGLTHQRTARTNNPPRLMRRWGRLGSGHGIDGASIVQVSTPTISSSSKPKRRCKSLTAIPVNGPNMPSTSRCAPHQFKYI